MQKLQEKVAALEPEGDVPEVPPRWEEAKKLAIAWTTEAGQVWRLGRHRLGIGSALEPEFLRKVQAGTAADQLLTDPPYGIGYAEKAEGLWRARKGPKWEKIEGDQADEIEDYRAWFRSFLIVPTLADYNTVYVFMAGRTLHMLRGAFDDAGITWGDYLVWVKHCPVLTRSDYHTQHEFIAFGWRNHHKRRVSPGTSTVIDEGIDLEQIEKMKKSELVELLSDILNSSNILRFDRPMKHERHPTEKPLDLVTTLIQQGSPAGGTVIDPFAGSGTTILAAQRANRTAQAVELRPEYAAVILQRWLDATGITPTLHDVS